MLAADYSQEDLIFQLANIGGYTTPIRTATPSNTTTPGSSKSRKWSGKLHKISRSKNNDSPSAVTTSRLELPLPPIIQSSPRSLSTSPQDVPLRSTSIPRPDSKFLKPALPRSSASFEGWKTPASVTLPSSLLSAKSTPPRVKPFDHPMHSSTNKKSYVYEPCCLCLEYISCRTVGEKVVSLECGHLVHEECLMTYFENPTSCHIDELFPFCRQCDNATRCLPSDIQLRDNCISLALIKSSPRSRNFPEQVLQPPGLKPVTLLRNAPRKNSAIEPKRFQFDVNRSASQSNKNVKDLFLRLSEFSRSKPEFSARGSVVSGISSIVSSVSNASLSVAFDSGGFPNKTEQLPPLTILRSYYSHLLLSNSHGAISGWEIDAKYGPLRLVDKLMFSEDGKTYQDACCYLFTDALVVALVSPTADPNAATGMRFNRFLTHHPISHTSVDSLNSSVLKCTILSEVKDSNLMQGSTLYLTETLNSTSSQVIEKWISGLLNKDILFSSSSFCSTLPPPLVTEGSSFSSLALNRPNSCTLNMDYADEVKTSEIIVRKGMSTANHNRRTTITSLLSLKRNRPKNLAIVLQIDPLRFRDGEIITLINSLKALVIKIKRATICVVDSEGGIVSKGLIQDQLTTFQKLKYMKCDSSRERFEPQNFKNSTCSDMVGDIGIAVFSNTLVEAGKSCLFMDYRPFASPGRKSPHELKVHIGFLNIDHTDQISELVEVNSVNDILEAVCYSFNLAFDEDEDDNDDEEDDDESDEENEYVNKTNSENEGGCVSDYSYLVSEKGKRSSTKSGTSSPYSLEDKSVRSDSEDADYFDYDVYAESVQQSPLTQKPTSSGTFCDISSSYSNISRTTAKNCEGASVTEATPRSAVCSLFYLRSSFQEVQGGTTVQISSEKINSSPLNTQGMVAGVLREDSAPMTGMRVHSGVVRGWSGFLEGINRKLDEAIDGNGALVQSDVEMGNSAYEYM